MDADFIKDINTAWNFVYIQSRNALIRSWDNSGGWLHSIRSIYGKFDNSLYTFGINIILTLKW